MLPAFLLASLALPADGRPFVQAHCVRCHGPAKKSGGVRLDDLPADASRAPDRWLAVHDQVRDGLMPPAREPQPDAAKAKALVAWVSAATGAHAAKLPNQGNLLPHELLFGTPAPAAAPPPRVWRLGPAGYLGLVRDLVKGNPKDVTQPFSLVPERGIKDFAGLYTIDEPTTEILLRNAEAIAENQVKNVREFKALADANPTPAQLAAAVQTQFRLAIGRAASPAEVERLAALYEKCARDGDRAGAVKTMLQAVLLKTDAMFRSELGGKPDGTGRRMLAPHELATALSLALRESRDPTLVKAGEKGELTTREQAAAHVRRMLDDPKTSKPRLIAFFHDYFGYTNAENVFKDKPKTFMHEPRQLVADTDRLVLHVLAEDKDVFRALLTTDRSFVNFSTVKDKKTKQEKPKRAVVPHPQNNKGQQGLEHVYGVEAWAEAQPMTLPKGTRLGVLMQPSWLIAHSTNFDNDPVRRGRWVRERLLGGAVPELPLGVAAQVPDDPHRTFRDRLTVTRDAKCWKCHNKMDDLGLPFEQFDHYGRFREAEAVVDVEATKKNVDKKGKPLGPVRRDAKLDTTGRVSDSGDAALDGPVRDPRELVRRIAASDRARQVFVRHAFRFFLGRNEALSDARALQAADAEYVKSGGSFKALVVALLTSDSFLYRSGGVK